MAGRIPSAPSRKQTEAVICESLTEARLTIHDGDRHKSIHLTRVQQVVILDQPQA
jgi:hypothetical protein